ncbi:MAG TPA: hypothetical protein VFH58_13505 [Acidimicrobiales bacterium]|nr:hypothetical protein [Acidimicrobiales bacterium]
MRVVLADEELYGLVECLSFVADFCAAEAPLISTALARFMPNTGWDAAVMRHEVLAHADRAAQALGFPDADLDPAKARPRSLALPT